MFALAAESGFNPTKGKRSKLKMNIQAHAMKTSTLSALATFLMVGNSISATAQGLFSGLANRQEEIEQTKDAVVLVIKQYDMTQLLKGELSRADDGSASIGLGPDGSVYVDIKLDVNPEKYDAWVTFATNTLAPFAAHICPKDTPIPRDYRSGPSIQIAGTTFVFPEDVKQAFKEIKASLSLEQGKVFFLRPPENPAVFVYLVDANGNIVAEPYKQNRDDRLTLDDVSRFKSQFGSVRFGEITFLDLARIWIDDPLLAQEVTPRPAIQWPSEVLAFLYKCHRPSIGLEVENWKPLSTIDRYGYDFEFEYRGAKVKSVSFGSIPNDKLEEIQGVQVCIGSKQFFNFIDKAAAANSQRK